MRAMQSLRFSLYELIRYSCSNLCLTLILQIVWKAFEEGSATVGGSSGCDPMQHRCVCLWFTRLYQSAMNPSKPSNSQSCTQNHQNYIALVDVAKDALVRAALVWVMGGQHMCMCATYSLLSTRTVHEIWSIHVQMLDCCSTGTRVPRLSKRYSC